MPPRARRSSKRAAAALASCLALGGCSFAIGEGNGGLRVLEASAPPVGHLAAGAKYAGWLAAAPAVLALVPLAALAWATPWVDLPLAVDLVTAPAIALGYVTQALVTLPVLGALAPLGPLTTPGAHADLVPLPPVGLVRARLPAGAPPGRAPDPVAPDDAAYYAPEPARVALAARAAARALEEGPHGEAPGSEASVELGDDLALEVVPAAGGARAPLVLLTPPTEATFAARYLARRFARRGVHAAVLVPAATLLDGAPDAPRVEARLRASVRAARAAVAALAARPEVDRVLYLGVSAGAIFGAALLAVEPRIERAALVFPGGDLARIATTSDHPTARAYRAAWAARGRDAAALEVDLRRAVRTEPLRLARHVDPARVVLFLGERDTQVPVACGWALRRALSGPETVVLAGDHATAALCFGFVLREIDRVLLER